MRAIRRTNTEPEVALRRALHCQGYRFRKDLRLDLNEGARVRPQTNPPAAPASWMARWVGKTLIEGMGNYLIAAGPQAGNSLIVSRSAGSP
jgi:DNA mismatch endonuclease Vsr